MNDEKNLPMSPDVLVIGGGNAALCAALMAREAGASVLLLESAPREWRGGNSGHTRNLRCMHDAPQDVLVDAYPEEEYWQDLLKVTGGLTNEHLARLVIRESSTCRDWMRRHGVHFQPPLSGALHVARTNAFFMGGGKALVNAYFRSAEKLGVQIRYEAPVDRIEIDNGRFIAAYVKGQRITAKACVLAAGGFESNREWLREAWGQNERGEWPADNFLIRGTAYNKGVLLRHLLEDHGADRIGDPTQAHMVAIDARAPLYDGGICTRIDCVSLGVVVNREAERFYDEGEDFWPKRYAIWGRLVAQQPGQIGYSIIDSKAIGRFMPPVFPGTACPSWRTSWACRWTPSCAPSTPTTPPAAWAASTTPPWTTAAPKASRPPRRTGRGPSTRRRSMATRSSLASPSRISACTPTTRPPCASTTSPATTCSWRAK